MATLLPGPLATVELSVEWDKSTGGEWTMGKKDETGPLLIAAPLSLSGRYAFQGRLAAVGLAQAACHSGIDG